MIKAVDMIYFYGEPSVGIAVAKRPHYRVRIFKDYYRPSVVIKTDLPTSLGPSLTNVSELIATDLVHTFMLYNVDSGTPDDVVWIDQHEHRDEPHGHLARVTYKWEYGKSVLEEMTGEHVDFEDYRSSFYVTAQRSEWINISVADVEALIGWELEPIYRAI